VSTTVRVPITDIVDQPGASRPVRDAVGAEAFGADPWGPADGAVLDPSNSTCTSTASWTGSWSAAL
jgi:hypothetical protein